MSHPSVHARTTPNKIAYQMAGTGKAITYRLVDAMALVTANHLEQQFLVVGAQVAEPTENVTAADWKGAGYRGEGLGLPEAFDPSTFTAERAGRALRAGVAAVLSDVTGIVIHVR